MADNAKQTIENMRGSLKKTANILDAFLFPLTVKRNLETMNNGTG
jgi:hypothetical protein